MNKKRAYIVVPLLLAILSALGQEIRFAGIDYYHYGKAEIKKAAQNSNVSYQEIAGFINVPFKLKDNKTIIINGTRFAWVRSNLYQDQLVSGIESSNATDFKTFSYTFGLIHRFEHWTSTLLLSPTLASDFERKINHNDFLMQGSFSLNKKLNQNLLMGGGIAYNTSLGSPLPLPLFQLIYSNGKQNINLFLPAFAEYSYTITAKHPLKIGVRSMLNGAYFNYSANNAKENSEDIDKIKYSRLNTGALLYYQLDKIFQVEVFTGISSFRKYRLQDTNNNEIKFDSKSSGFFNIGFRLLLPTKKDITSRKMNKTN